MLIITQVINIIGYNGSVQQSAGWPVDSNIYLGRIIRLYYITELYRTGRVRNTGNIYIGYAAITDSVALGYKYYKWCRLYPDLCCIIYSYALLIAVGIYRVRCYYKQYPLLIITQVINIIGYNGSVQQSAGRPVDSNIYLGRIIRLYYITELYRTGRVRNTGYIYIGYAAITDSVALGYKYYKWRWLYPDLCCIIYSYALLIAVGIYRVRCYYKQYPLLIITQVINIIGYDGSVQQSAGRAVDSNIYLGRIIRLYYITELYRTGRVGNTGNIYIGYAAITDSVALGYKYYKRCRLYPDLCCIIYSYALLIAIGIYRVRCYYKQYPLLIITQVINIIGYNGSVQQSARWAVDSNIYLGRIIRLYYITELYRTGRVGNTGYIYIGYAAITDSIALGYKYYKWRWLYPDLCCIIYSYALLIAVGIYRVRCYYKQYPLLIITQVINIIGYNGSVQQSAGRPVDSNIYLGRIIRLYYITELYRTGRVRNTGYIYIGYAAITDSVALGYKYYKWRWLYPDLCCIIYSYALLIAVGIYRVRCYYKQYPLLIITQVINIIGYNGSVQQSAGRPVDSNIYLGRIIRLYYIPELYRTGRVRNTGYIYIGYAAITDSVALGYKYYKWCWLYPDLCCIIYSYALLIAVGIDRVRCYYKQYPLLIITQVINIIGYNGSVQQSAGRPVDSNIYLGRIIRLYYITELYRTRRVGNTGYIYIGYAAITDSVALGYKDYKRCWLYPDLRRIIYSYALLFAIGIYRVRCYYKQYSLLIITQVINIISYDGSVQQSAGRPVDSNIYLGRIIGLYYIPELYRTGRVGNTGYIYISYAAITDSVDLGDKYYKWRWLYPDLCRIIYSYALLITVGIYRVRCYYKQYPLLIITQVINIIGYNGSVQQSAGRPVDSNIYLGRIIRLYYIPELYRTRRVGNTGYIYISYAAITDSIALGNKDYKWGWLYPDLCCIIYSYALLIAVGIYRVRCYYKQYPLLIITQVINIISYDGSVQQSADRPVNGNIYLGRIIRLYYIPELYRTGRVGNTGYIYIGYAAITDSVALGYKDYKRCRLYPDLCCIIYSYALLITVGIYRVRCYYKQYPLLIITQVINIIGYNGSVQQSADRPVDSNIYLGRIIGLYYIPELYRTRRVGNTGYIYIGYAAITDSVDLGDKYYKWRWLYPDLCCIIYSYALLIAVGIYRVRCYYKQYPLLIITQVINIIGYNGSVQQSAGRPVDSNIYLGRIIRLYYITELYRAGRVGNTGYIYIGYAAITDSVALGNKDYKRCRLYPDLRCIIYSYALLIAVGIYRVRCYYKQYPLLIITQVINIIGYNGSVQQSADRPVNGNIYLGRIIGLYYIPELYRTGRVRNTGNIYIGYAAITDSVALGYKDYKRCRLYPDLCCIIYSYALLITVGIYRVRCYYKQYPLLIITQVINIIGYNGSVQQSAGRTVIVTFTWAGLSGSIT